MDVAGRRLLIREWGDLQAPPLLYWIPLGSTSNALYFAEIGETLAARYGFRALSFDPPGFGGSPHGADESYEPRELAQLTAELLTALGIERAAVVGFSWGGLIGVEFAVAHPGRTRALVLIEGGYIDPSERPEIVGLSPAERLAQAREGLAKERFPSWEAFVEAERGALARWTPAIEEATRFGAREQDGQVVPLVQPEVLAAVMHGIASTPIAPLLAGLRATAVPVLLLAADEPPERAEVRAGAVERFRAGVPRAEVRVLHGGHDLIDAIGPDEIARIVGEWLSEVYADERT